MNFNRKIKNRMMMIIKIKMRSPNGIKNDKDKNNKKHINNNHNTHTAIWIKQKVI